MHHFPRAASFMTASSASDAQSQTSQKKDIMISEKTVDNIVPHQSEGDANMAVYGHAEHVTYSQEEGDRVKRKIDWVLLPLLCGCYMFSFLDKTLLNYSSIFGLQKALHLHGTNYSWTGSIFYFGYMLGSPTWSKIIQRYPQHTGKVISGAVFAWSCIIMLTPLCTNFTGLMIDRFFLGFVESVTGPAFVVYTSNFWTRSEGAFRTAFWLSGTPIGNFFGGALSYGLGSLRSGIPTWKIFFLFFGSFSVAFSLLLAYYLPDNQSNARFLNAREKAIAIERVRINQNVSSSHEWKWSQFFETFKDPQVYLIFATAMAGTMPSTLASQFSSQIVKGFGFSAVNTTVLSSCPAALIQLGNFLILSYWASRVPNMRLILSFFSSLPPVIGAVLLHVLPQSNVAGRLTGYYLTYFHSVSFTLATGLMAANFAGHTKKTTASAFIFVGWAAGLIAGPQFFLAEQAPVYQKAIVMVMICYSLSAVLPFILGAWYILENRRRDRLVGGSVHVDASELEFTDKSDFELEATFRYVY